MWFVYFLESQKHPRYIYVGLTNNIERRFAEHNAVNSKLATAPYRPLKLSGYLAVCDERHAKELEQYFKVGSGKAFVRKRIVVSGIEGSAKYGAIKNLTKPVNRY